jgi:hypothetical protein
MKMLLCPAPEKFNTFITFNTFNPTPDYPTVLETPSPLSRLDGRGVGGEDPI